MNEHPELNITPGYDTSKGEPGIVKAFQKLWTKIERLQQVRLQEKNSSSKKTQTNGSDITITDIQYQILVTQLRYITKLAREFGSGKNQVLEQPPENASGFPTSLTAMENSPDKDSNHKVIGEHGMSQQEHKETEKISHTLKSNSIPAAAHKKPQQCHSKVSSHYHLNLDDVPFILGASSSASHSVVANVQNIIAMMKSHNKALCAPKHHRREPAAKQNTNDMLQELSQDLSKLTMKQEKLKLMLDKASGQRAVSRNTKVKENKPENKTYKNKFPRKDHARPQTQLDTATQSEEPEVVKRLTEVKRPSSRSQVSRDPQFARRRILRSLKDFKTHLSAEDIAWN